MTENIEHALRKLDAAAAGRETDRSKEHGDAPEWAIDLLRNIEENSRQIEAAIDRRTALEKRLAEDLGERVDENARRVKAIAGSTSAARRRRTGAEKNGTRTARKFDEAWDDTFEIDRAR